MSTTTTESPIDETKAVEFDGEREDELRFSQGTALALNNFMITVLAVSSAVCFLCTYIMYAKQRLRQQVQGPAANKSNSLWLYAGGIALGSQFILIMCLFAFLPNNEAQAPCAVHSALEKSLIPIVGTSYLLRAWVMIIQFATINEQLRWFHRHNGGNGNALNGIPEQSDFDEFLVRNAFLRKPTFLVPVALVWGALMWMPGVIYETVIQEIPCDESQFNYAEPVCLALFIIAVILLATRLVKGSDTTGVKKELQRVAFVFLVVRITQEIFEDQFHVVVASSTPPQVDAATLYVESSMSFWFHHILMGAMSVVWVIISFVFPLVRLWQKRNILEHKRGAKTMEQKLLATLTANDTRLQFQEFLQAEFSVENLIFWQAATDYSRDVEAENLKTDVSSKAIYDCISRAFSIEADFILSSGKFQVNLPSMIYKDTIKAFDGLRAINYFVVSVEETDKCNNHSATDERALSALRNTAIQIDRCSHSIFTLMASDSFARFLRQSNEKSSFASHVQTGGASKLNTSALPNQQITLPASTGPMRSHITSKM